MKDLSVAKKILGIKIRKDQNAGKLYLWEVGIGEHSSWGGLTT